MPSPTYTLRFYTADDQDQIVPLDLTPSDGPCAHLIPFPEFDGILRRIQSLWQTYPGHPTLDRIHFFSQTAGMPSPGNICVLLVRTEHLCSPRFFYQLSNGPLRRTDPPPGGSTSTDKTDSRFVYRPVITLGAIDITDIYAETFGADYENEAEIRHWLTERQERGRLYQLGLDHRVKFLDSSIWHRYVPTTDIGFDQRLLRILTDIVQWADMYLYEAPAALATLEFHCRILQHAFIANFGDRGHPEAVTPFKFHSETIMANKAQKILERFFSKKREKDTCLADLKWNILFVDDYAHSKLVLRGKANPTDQDEFIPTKKDIIEQVLFNFAGYEMPRLHFETARKDGDIIGKGIHLLQDTAITYDLILLDYLLGSSKAMPGLKSYGHEFLLELATHSKRRSFRRGPMGKYWILPASSFPFAFWDKLRQMNLEGPAEQWHIAGGGDPITTPALFRLNFLRLLAAQIAEYYLHEAGLERWIDRFESISKKEEWTHAVRTQIFADRAKSKVLARECGNNSAFAQSMEDFLNQQTEYKTFWENLLAWTQLLDNYQYGQPTSELLDQLGNLLGQSGNRYEFVHERIYRQACNFIKDAEQTLKSSLFESLTNLTFSNEHLFVLPKEVPSLCPNLEKLDLSYNNLSFFCLAREQWPLLRTIDLSGNTDLNAIEVAPLRQMPFLRQLKIHQTRLGNTLNRSFANNREEVLHLLDQIDSRPAEIPSRSAFSGLPLVYLLYATEDHALAQGIYLHLKLLERTRSAEIWHPEAIELGTDRLKMREDKLNTAHITLLLESVDLLNSIDFMEHDYPILKERYERKQCRVIPIYLRKCSNDDLFWASLQGLPANQQPVSTWQNQDEVFYQIALELRKIIKKYY